MIILFAEQSDEEAVLNVAYDQGILGPGFVWIGGDSMHSLNLSAYLFLFNLFDFIIILSSNTRSRAAKEGKRGEGRWWRDGGVVEG